MPCMGLKKTFDESTDMDFSCVRGAAHKDGILNWMASFAIFPGEHKCSCDVTVQLKLVGAFGLYVSVVGAHTKTLVDRAVGTLT
jgi:hypothetical protein